MFDFEMSAIEKIIIIRFAVRLLCSICRVSSNSDIILLQKQTNNI